jgi:hypothetical protein
LPCRRSDSDWRSAPPADWQAIFNGRNLDGWVMKLAHHDLGTITRRSAEDGVIRGYDSMAPARFATCSTSRNSHYVLALEYRFFGEQARGGPGWRG